MVKYEQDWRILQGGLVVLGRKKNLIELIKMTEAIDISTKNEEVQKGDDTNHRLVVPVLIAKEHIALIASEVINLPTKTDKCQ